MSKNLRCMLTGHDYSDWESGNEQIKCKQVQTCTRCNHKNTREWGNDHQFGEFEYRLPTSCEMVRICQNCGFEEKFELEAHQFGPVETYIIDAFCIDAQFCIRCNFEKKLRDGLHNLMPEYLSEDSCEAIFKCKYCGSAGWTEGKLILNTSLVWCNMKQTILVKSAGLSEMWLPTSTRSRY